MKISRDARLMVLSWLENVENGDTIAVKDGYITIKNSLGCEIDCARIEEYND